MPLSFAEQLSGIQKSRLLAVSLERAYDYAREGRSGEVTLEHFLLALTEDSEAIAVLDACNVDLDRLRTDVAGYLGRASAQASSGADPVAAPLLLRTIKQAEAAAKQSGRPQLNGGIVLAAIVGDGSSDAAQLLQGQGLTFQGTLKALQTSASTSPSASASASIPRPALSPTTATKTTPAVAKPAPAAPAATAAATTANAAPAPVPVVAPIAAEVPASRVEQTVVDAPATSTPDTSAPGAAATETDAPSTADVLASVRERLEAKQRGTARPPAAAAAPKAESDAAPAQEQPVPAPLHQPDDMPMAAINRVQPAPVPAPDPAQLADKWARAIDGPDATPLNQDALQAAAAPAPVTPSPVAPAPIAPAKIAPVAAAVQVTPAAPVATSERRLPEVAPAPPGGAAARNAPSRTVVAGRGPADAAAAMEPWPEPRDQQQRPTQSTQAPATPLNGNIAGAPYAPADDTAAPVPYAPAPYAPPQGLPPRASHVPPRAPAPQPAAPRQAPAGQSPAAAAAPSQARQSGRAKAPAATVESGQLLETIPRFMKVAIPATVEVRIARDNVEAPGEGMQGRAPVQRHDLLVTKAMSVKLKAPDGGFWIETASPETQWIENKLGLLHDDFASWRWTVTPRRRGTARLQMVVSARTVGTDGLAAETQLPDQIVTVKVRMNYKKSFKKLGGWALAALAGGIISALGGGLLTGGGVVQKWLGMIGL